MKSCRHPDHDNARLVCGRPLPCPYHTAILDLQAQPVPTITIPVTSDAAMAMSARERLASIGLVLRGATKRRRRR